MPFFEPVWYNRVLVNWPRAHSGVLQLTEASYLGPDSPRTSPRNETVKQCRRQMANSPVLWPSWTWCRIWWNHSWDSSRVTLNQRCFVFIRPCTHQVYRYYVISQTQSNSAVFGCSPIGVDGVALTAGPCLTVEQLLYWSDSIWTGRAAPCCIRLPPLLGVGFVKRALVARMGRLRLDAKTKFRFGNIVPKQLTLLGFVQHTSASSVYKDNDNKISRQQKVLHMNKCLNVWHILKRVLA